MTLYSYILVVSLPRLHLLHDKLRTLPRAGGLLAVDLALQVDVDREAVYLGMEGGFLEVLLNNVHLLLGLHKFGDVVNVEIVGVE